MLGYAAVDIGFAEHRLAAAGYCGTDIGHCILGLRCIVLGIVQ